MPSIRALSVSVALVLILSGCGTPQPDELVPLFDLAGGFAIAEVDAETPVLDLGTLDTAPRLTRGWATGVVEPTGEASVWSVGGSSEIEFFLVQPRNLTTRVRYQALNAPELGPQRVTFEINGQEISTFEVGPDWQVDSMVFPEDLLQAGTNRLLARYAWARSPRELGRSRDGRRLAVRWDRIEFDTSAPTQSTLSAPTESGEARAVDGQLFLPFGSQASFFLELPSPASIEAASLVTRGTSGRLEIWAQRDGEPERRIATWRDGETALNSLIAVKDDRLGLAGIRLRAIQATGGTASPQAGVVLRDPRLLGPPSTEGTDSSSDALAETETQVQEAESSTETANSSPRPPNLILYMIDTLRADHLGCYGYPKPISPRIDAFASHATLFRNAVAVSSWTRPTVATMLTGLAPDVHRVEARGDALSAEVDLLPEILSAADYRSLAVVTNGNVAGQFGFNQGWDQFSRLQRGHATAWNVNQIVLDWLDTAATTERRRPFFLYLHTIEPHASYNPPTQYRKQFAPTVKLSDFGSRRWLKRLRAGGVPITPQVIEDLIALYDAEIAANDAAFGELLDALDARGMSNDTMIVLVSDHGEEFHEHGRWEHGKTLHTEVIDIPLIVRFPGQQDSLRPARQVDHLDIAPTLLGASGLDIPVSFEGRDLATLATEASDEIGKNPLEDEHKTLSFLRLDGFEAHSISQPQWRLIESDSVFSGRGSELFDRWNDAKEIDDLAEARPVLAGFLRTHLRLRQAGAAAGTLGLRPDQADLDDELIEELRALGYID